MPADQATPLPDYIKPPLQPGGAGNNTNVLLFTATTASKVDAIPDSWRGQYAVVQAIGANIRWFLSVDGAASCDFTIAPTDAGAASDELGSFLAVGDSRHVVLQVPDDGTVYLVRESDSDDGSLEIALA